MTSHKFDSNLCSTRDCSGTQYTWEAIDQVTANFTPDITPLVLAGTSDVAVAVVVAVVVIVAFSVVFAVVIVVTVVFDVVIVVFVIVIVINVVAGTVYADSDAFTLYFDLSCSQALLIFFALILIV